MGCAGLMFQTADVAFEDASARLSIISVQPNEKEKAGLELRMLAPPGGVSKFKEDDTLFASIKDDKGKRLQFTMEQAETYTPGSSKDSLHVLSETTITGQKGSLLEEKEISARGEILRFIRGFHHSSIGKFRITNWTRTPIFPEGPVKTGDQWNYEEALEARVDAWWLKEINPEPYRMKAESTLEGFARVRDTRCAVIKTRTSQTKHEHFKILFKEIIFDIQTRIEETSYFDYAAGTVVARITRNFSHTTGSNMPLDDTGQSQSILVRE